MCVVTRPPSSNPDVSLVRVKSLLWIEMPYRLYADGLVQESLKLFVLEYGPINGEVISRPGPTIRRPDVDWGVVRQVLRIHKLWIFMYTCLPEVLWKNVRRRT